MWADVAGSFQNMNYVSMPDKYSVFFYNLIFNITKKVKIIQKHTQKSQACVLKLGFNLHISF